MKLRDPAPYYSALNRLWEILGPEAELPTEQQKVASFERVRANLMGSGLTDRSARRHAGLLRALLRGAIPHGLDPACIKALANLPFRIPHHAVIRLQKSHLKTILEQLRFQVETIRLLIWIALSGGSQIVDAVLLRFSHVDWNTGLISYPAFKTGASVQFAALPPLMTLLSERRARLGPDAVYVLPELVFTEAELKNATCNTRPRENPTQAVAMRASMKATHLVASFFKSCGLDEQGVTYKAFRSNQISFWAAIGVRVSTRMRMAGHSHELSHNRCDVPTEIEFMRVRDITWSYLEAVQGDKAFECPTSIYDLHASLKSEFDRLAEALAKAHREVLEQCQRLLDRISQPPSA